MSVTFNPNTGWLFDGRRVDQMIHRMRTGDATEQDRTHYKAFLIAQVMASRLTPEQAQVAFDTQAVGTLYCPKQQGVYADGETEELALMRRGLI